MYKNVEKQNNFCLLIIENRKLVVDVLSFSVTANQIKIYDYIHRREAQKQE